MQNKCRHDICEKLLDNLYSRCSYGEFTAAVDFAIRAYERISKNDMIFNADNLYLKLVNCEDKLIYTVFKYYLDGNGKEEYLNEDIFPIINVLSGNKSSISATELKQLFLNVYKQRIQV